MNAYANYISSFTYDRLDELEELETEDNKIEFNYNVLNEISNLPSKIEKSDFLKMICEISTEETKYYYNIEKRNEIEFYGAYKNSIERDVPLNEVKVVNLNFTIVKCKISKSDSVQASMLIAEDKMEWILVFPCLTEYIIEQERKIYLDTAKDLLAKGIIEPEHENDLLENLNLLTLTERCTQTLIHEFGHILNWRIFNSIVEKEDNLGTMITCLVWFKDKGYFHNVAKRKIGFLRLPFEECISLLKESFAEDYRMGSCIRKIGKYVLPNTVCNIGDLYNENYMKEGIDIVMKIVDEYKSNDYDFINNVGNSEQEIDRVTYAKEEYKLLEKSNYKFSIPTDEEIEKQFELYINTIKQKNNRECKELVKFNGITFIDKCLEGDALLEEVDEYVNEWNAMNYDCKLHEFLGLTEEENKLWSENNLALELIVEARECEQSIEDYLNNIDEYQLAARAQSEEEAVKIKKWLIEQGKVV